MNKATHGWDPNGPLMGATFIAWGPAFRQHATIKPFENVHMYNLLCATLGLKPAPNDGDNRLLTEVLAEPLSESVVTQQISHCRRRRKETL